jgi:rhodanese-related sulfurtransferase
MSYTLLRKEMIISRIHEGIGHAVLLIILGLLLGTGFNAIRSHGLSWIGSHSSSHVAVDSFQDLRKISLGEAWSLYLDGKAVFLDAREHLWFQEGHLPGALNIPVEDVKSDLETVKSLDKKGLKLIAYCDGNECSLAAELALSLERYGVRSVRILVEGWFGWLGAGYYVEKGEMR